MRLTFLFFILLWTNFLLAEDFLYFKNAKGCSIKAYRNGKLLEVQKAKFFNIPIESKQLINHPKVLIFKVNEDVYLASTACAFLDNDEGLPKKVVYDTSPIENFNDLLDEKTRRQLEDYDYATTHKLSEDAYKLKVANYFVEVNTGFVMLNGKSQVPGDYNVLFPSDPTAPTSWGEAGDASYSPRLLFNFDFGMKKSDIRYLVLKLRMFKGSKTDTLTLTTVNTSTTVEGNWNFSDIFLNYYAGYKFIFSTNSSFKPCIGAYLGLSSGSTIISDGKTGYKFSSLGIAGLIEGGVEYELALDLRATLNFAHEFLGTRTMNLREGPVNAATFKTKLDYSSNNITLGIKKYF